MCKIVRCQKFLLHYFFRWNTGTLKRNVTRAILNVGKLAEELCHVPNTGTLKTNMTLLTTEENELLSDDLKRLFDSSDYDN